MVTNNPCKIGKLKDNGRNKGARPREASLKTFRLISSSLTGIDIFYSRPCRCLVGPFSSSSLLLAYFRRSIADHRLRRRSVLHWPSAASRIPSDCSALYGSSVLCRKRSRVTAELGLYFVRCKKL
ncbi:hypothetical protein IEQ34_004430 [Dendrobium chrysotoxum]|uniref:Uncharacterized protein n=1 Tax=Dendrobium chrysotoxum TaxID=161865 RepID=A0AAV7HH42_DENCH|nr:hypothetical protein IEQ34_004430 [Dendrobium chrysotoxum]